MTPTLPTRKIDAPSAPHAVIAPSEIDGIVDAVDRHDIIDVLHRTAQTAMTAADAVADRRLLKTADRLISSGDASALAMIEILAAIPGRQVDERLADLLETDDELLRRHASWRLGVRAPQLRALPSLLHELQRGGLDTMHAHRTLRVWARDVPVPVLRCTNTALAATSDPAARARLIDLIGVVPDRGTDELLVDVAVDEQESDAARIAAIGALGERRSGLIGNVLTHLASDDGIIGAHAALALRADEPTTPRPRSTGLRVAQLVLADGLDGQLSLGGRGETGGVASLLVSLSSALGRHTAIDHVVTIGRGTVADALTGPLAHIDEPWSFGTIAVGDPSRPMAAPAAAWEHLPAIERGLRRVLRLAGPIDLLHLRMADAGTLAGAAVANAAAIPVCFSLAPDPHNVVQSAASTGELDAAAFTRLESEQHIWFRARLVERLGREADRVAMFPRVRTFDFIGDIDRDGTGRRSAVVPEGIDLSSIARAERELAQTSRTPLILAELADHIPVDRRNLPLLVSVGRLHPVKGMDRIVAAWAADDALIERCNLVIVGGDLQHPTEVERNVLASIESHAAGHPGAGSGVILLGGRPHDDVARLLVAAGRGHGSAWASGGVYVDGAAKEEFGLAVLEALASGLVVVAPSIGGPATYVDHGDTGVLVDPGDDLAAAIRCAYDLVDRDGRARRARRMIERRYSIDTMAQRLVELYRPVAA